MPAQDASAWFLELVIGQDYDPTGLHCWELVRQCQQTVFKRDLPLVLVAPERRRELLDMMELRKLNPHYVEVPEPVHGAVVFMTKNGHDVSRAACHAGVWLDLDGGGILHTDDPHGVVFETMLQIKLRNWGDFSWYAHKEGAP